SGAPSAISPLRMRSGMTSYACSARLTRWDTDSDHIPAAVDVDGLSSDVTVGSEEHCSLRDFIDVAEASHWNARGRRVRVGRDHVGGDQRGRDRIHGDALGGEVCGVVVSKPVHAGLRRGVVRSDDAAYLCGDGGDVDDASPLARPHAGKDGLRDQEARLQVAGDDLVPVALSDFGDRLWARDAGVVDATVDRACLSAEALDVTGAVDRGLDGAEGRVGGAV